MKTETSNPSNSILLATLLDEIVKKLCGIKCKILPEALRGVIIKQEQLKLNQESLSDIASALVDDAKQTGISEWHPTKVYDYGVLLPNIPPFLEALCIGNGEFVIEARFYSDICWIGLLIKSPLKKSKNEIT